jgi:prophage antirepressor-like protein
MSTPGGKQEVSIISEKGIYAIIMRSRRKEAEAFQDWVFEVIKSLRQATGLEGFQVFRMLDKEHQLEAMNCLKEGLSNPVKVDYIKANTIANKAVSSLHGYRKMVKKRNMSPNMLIQRQQILDDTVNLMTANESFRLGLSVSKTVYGKYLIA